MVYFLSAGLSPELAGLTQSALFVTVINPQSQGALPDCGLFAAANMLALLKGINPESLTFDQTRMRDHLYAMIREENPEQLSMFSHQFRQSEQGQREDYTIERDGTVIPGTLAVGGIDMNTVKIPYSLWKNF